MAQVNSENKLMAEGYVYYVNHDTQYNADRVLEVVDSALDAEIDVWDERPYVHQGVLFRITVKVEKL